MPSDDDLLLVKEEEVDYPPPVLKPRNEKQYETMTEYLDGITDDVIDTLIGASIHGASTAPLIEMWGKFLSLQRNLLYSMAFEEGWDNEAFIEGDIDILIREGLKEVAAPFDEAAQMAQFLEAAEAELKDGYKEHRREVRKGKKKRTKLIL